MRKEGKKKHTHTHTCTQKAEGPMKLAIQIEDQVDFSVDIVTSSSQIKKASKMQKSHTVFTLTQQVLSP